MRAIVLCLALLALPAQAREWTDDELRWGAALAVTRLVDWGQTRYIAKHPDRFREVNPLIGDHPSLGEVNRHFIVSTALMFAAAHYLPQYRTRLLQVYVVVGAGYVVHNIGIGVRFQF